MRIISNKKTGQVKTLHKGATSGWMDKKTAWQLMKVIYFKNQSS